MPKSKETLNSRKIRLLDFGDRLLALFSSLHTSKAGLPEPL